MRNSPFWWVLILFMVLVDIYFFQALKSVSHSLSGRGRTILYIVYWSVSVLAIVTLILLPYLHFEKQNKYVKTIIFSVTAAIFFAKLFACLFFLIDDLRRGIQWLITKFSSKQGIEEGQTEKGISRSAFLNWTGMIAGSGLLGTLVYGFGNKYRYQVKRVKLSYANLPASFIGMKVVHISDIHSGSFTNKKAVMRGVQKILNEKPDLVLFTGDLVNNRTNEVDDYMDVFSKVKAPMGVYSTLGNHDYGDYMQWDSPEEKKGNLDRMKEVHRELGWRLLMNEHVVLEKGNDRIALIGIENWSAKARFPKYGDLNKAYQGAASYPFKILMSHDPSHWRAQVLEDYKDIDLMLSGHTHGMQFGLEIPGVKWSPVQYFYKEWAGLYEKDNQKLYVNRGYGFIGYPGRVGILPEITVFEFI